VGVEGDHDRVAPDRLGPLHEGVDDAVVPAPVELVPAGRVTQRGRDLLHRHRALRGDDHGQPEVARGRGHGALGLPVRHLEHPDRGEQQGRGDPAAEQLHRGVPLLDVDQHPRHDPVPVEGLQVGPGRALLPGAAGDVRPGLAAHPALGGRLEGCGLDGDDGPPPEDTVAVDPALDLATHAGKARH
jgi:hypothetical protein